MKTAARALLLITLGFFAAHCGDGDNGGGSGAANGGPGGGGTGGDGGPGGGGGGGNGDGGTGTGANGDGGDPWGAFDAGGNPWNTQDGGGMGTVVYGDAGRLADGAPVSGDGSTNHGEICGNGFDDNHDGMVDENCPCLPGHRQYCYPGDPSHAGVAGCAWGLQVCTGGEEFGTWGACTGYGSPTPESCDGHDNNCDGIVDEGCPCTLGATRSCYTGPPGTTPMAPCHPGTQTCTADPAGHAAWGTCTGEITPELEHCDGIDNNCNGVIDEGCLCTLGATRSCYTGAAGTSGVGACHAGVQTCAETSEGGSDWGACAGEVLPTAPSCGAGVDSRCDGHPDEGCPCSPGTTAPCYDGPAGTAGVGICHTGRMTCTASGWSACMGEQTPLPETCNGMDDNCTGVMDEWCLCGAGSTVTFHRRDFTAMGDRSMISPGDGRPLMPQDCGPMRCPTDQVAVETSAGVFQCVAPPPTCPAGTFANYAHGLYWRCDRPCEVIITYGALFGNLVVCAPRPTITCPNGQTPYFAYETETWVCRPTCHNGEYDLYHLGTIPICVPC